jgi:hypothetical protein
VLRWDDLLEPESNDMEFRLTYAGTLLAHRQDRKQAERSLHVHSIRKAFHPQLKKLRETHPIFTREGDSFVKIGSKIGWQEFDREGFKWVPIATRDNALICKVEMLLLRDGPPGSALADIDNKLKTVFDALRMPHGPSELGAGTRQGKQSPDPGEDPFYVLMEDDSLITHVAVTTDRLLEEIPDVPPQNAARLFVDVTIRPYATNLENARFV